MKQPAQSIVFHVSLIVLVPLIVAGIAVLTLFLSNFVPFIQRDVSDNQHWIALLVAATTFTSCALLLSLILRPVRRFLGQAKQSGIFALKPEHGDAATSLSDLRAFHTALEQVGQALSRMDAKAWFPDIIGQSKILRAVLGQVVKVAPTSASVLLTGESGTGKELIAQAIHGHSPRRDNPLVVVNCAAIPENLLESELFGHERGAFTGAVATRQGKFEAAHKGTLFLDEVGDMPLPVQAKILRVLETGCVERVGGTKTIRCDVRIMAATNQNLSEMVLRNTFREDLFHRLNVFPLHLPPLRERREDIPALAEHFLTTHGKHAAGISTPALGLLMAHAWPGNVRELRNVLERAAVLAGDGHIRPEHLPGLDVSGFGMSSSAGQQNNDNDDDTLDDRLANMERTLIEAALARTNGVQAQAARILGIKERSLWHRIKKLEIDVQAFKSQ